MSRFPRKTPGSEGKDRSNWSNEPLKGGGQVFGWLAGEPVWVVLHPLKPSKPCRHELTNGALVCPHCQARNVPVLRAYVPFYRDDGAPKFVIIPDYNADGLRGVSTRQAIRCFRGRGIGDPIRVIRDPKTPDYKPPHAGREEPVCIEGALLRIWGVDELIRFFAETTTETTPEVPAPVKTEDTPGEVRYRVDDESRERIRRWMGGPNYPGDQGGPQLVGDALPEVTEPSRNGRRKPK